MEKIDKALMINHSKIRVRKHKAELLLSCWRLAFKLQSWL